MNDGDTVIDDSGFIPDANLPGDSQGETSGLYAGMTENTVDKNGLEYFAANPGTRTDFLSGLSSWISQAGGVVSNIMNSTTRAQQQKAQSDWQKQQGYRPTLAEQWQSLDTFSKFGFVAAVLGIVWALKKA